MIIGGYLIALEDYYCLKYDNGWKYIQMNNLLPRICLKQ